jgi:16S rRNA (guanine527-N7)-methyltransferase
MDLARISALLGPFLEKQSLSEIQLQSISTYINLLLHWNSRINLTAIRDPEEIVTRHFGESLFLALHLFPDPPTLPKICILDIGSGAGLPGLPLKIWAPNISLILVESNHKKAAFLREVIRTLTLTTVNVITARAETLIDTYPRSDVVTLRAVERFKAILPTATRLVAPTGRLALLISAAQLPDLEINSLGLDWARPIPIPQSHSRMLAISIPH